MNKKHSCTKSYLFVCLLVIYFFISSSKVSIAGFYVTWYASSDTWWLCKFVWAGECVFLLYTHDLGFLCNCRLLWKCLLPLTENCLK